MLRIKFIKKVGNTETGLGSVIKVFSNVGASSLADLLKIKADCLEAKDIAIINATNAVNAASSALASKDAAATSETNAAASASSALASKNAAATSESNAAESASSALASKNAAATSEANAAASESLAVDKAAEAFASANSALASKNTAATSESNAADSADSALASKNAAATSETNAAEFADSALASKNAAATSETNAADSASSALTSKNAAATSEANAADSANSALASKNAAATSETNAAESRNIALTKASEAAISASTASTAATTATTKAAEAVVSANNALSEADRAEVEANKAMMAVTSLYAMTEAQFEANRAQNRQLFAASGYESFGKHENESSQVSIVNQGLNTYSGITTYANTIGLGRDGMANPSLLSGKSKSRFPVIHVAGCIYTLEYLGTVYAGFEAARVKFPQAPDGKTTYNKVTGVNTVHASASDAFAAQAADPTNVEVVINRVDGWLKEVWAEEVSATNPYIYPNGLPQSLATTMDGITTSSSNRPVSYYAFFSGDASSKGKGLNFFSLTDSQKKKVLANPKNNLVLLNDGKLVQWRLRIRTFAGAGNGDWLNIESVATNQFGFTEYLGYDSKTYIKPQGLLDYSLAPSGTYPTYAGHNGHERVEGMYNIGCFLSLKSAGTPDDSVAINGECYALFGGTVKRLNQGAYHPSYNPSGSRGYSVDGGHWYNTAEVIGTTLDTFTKCYQETGGIGTPSGRPDGRYYDGIYADGDGGVCRDMRYSAYGKTLEDFAEADQLVKNGTYRGFENQVFTRIVPQIGQSVYVSGTVDVLKSSIPYTPVVGEYLSAFNANTGLYYRSKITSMSQDGSGNVWWIGIDKVISRVENSYIFLEQSMQSSVGGSFLQTDVIGNPVNILATPALANGWQGRWGGLPEIGSGITRKQLVRKCLSTVTQITYTVNNGVSWGFAGAEGVDNTTNTVGHVNVSANIVYLDYYQAFAKQTEPAANAVVYGEVAQYIYASMSHRPDFGVLLGESLIGKVATSYPALNIISVCRDSMISLCKGYAGALYGGAIDNSVGVSKHNSLSLSASGSPAFKALNYDVNLNQQAFIQYAYTELKHNGTNWGDDGKVTIVDNQATKTDLNGNTVLLGTAKIKEPIGWIKNKD